MGSFQKQLAWIEENFKEVTASSTVAIDMKYATTDNFMQTDVYAGFDRCFLSPLAHARFTRACERLSREYPHLQFVIWDTLRPREVQALFYSHLRDTPFQNYVAAPQPGSLHNFGMAIDLGLQTQNGVLLDMGTGFDDFRDLAQPKLESHFLQTGELTQEQHANRLILRDLLEAEGFRVLEHEWWHFNALPKEEVHGKFPVLE